MSLVFKSTTWQNLWINHGALKFLRDGVYENFINDVNKILANVYRQKFEDFFLSDENNLPLNRQKISTVDSYMPSSLFIECTALFSTTFSFNRDLKLGFAEWWQVAKKEKISCFHISPTDHFIQPSTGWMKWDLLAFKEMKFFARFKNLGKITLQNRMDNFLKWKADITVYRGFVFWQIWNNINRNNSKKKEKKERSCFFLEMALLK